MLATDSNGCATAHDAPESRRVSTNSIGSFSFGLHGDGVLSCDGCPERAGTPILPSKQVELVLLNRRSGSKRKGEANVWR